MCVMRHGQAIAELRLLTHVALNHEAPAVPMNSHRQRGCHLLRRAGPGTSDDHDDDQSRSSDCHAARQDCGRRSRRRRVDSGAEGSGRLPGSRSLACPPGWRQRMRRFASEAPSKEDPGPPEAAGSPHRAHPRQGPSPAGVGNRAHSPGGQAARRSNSPGHVASVAIWAWSTAAITAPASGWRRSVRTTAPSCARLT